MLEQIASEQLNMLGKQERINILISDTAPLYPPLWGGPKRIWNLYSHLSESLFDITYVGVDHATQGELSYKFNKINSNFKEILCFLPPHSCFWYLIEQKILKNTTLFLFPYFFIHTDWQFSQVINQQEKDIVICSHPWSWVSIAKSFSKFVVYDAHNCEYLLMKQILANHPFRDIILKKVKNIEGDLVKKSDLLLVCSEQEKQEFQDIYKISPNKICIVSNGASIKPLSNGNKRDECKRQLGLAGHKIICFVGANYKPNNDGAKFISNVLARELPEYTFLIIGTVKNALSVDKIPGNVRLTGRISDEELDNMLIAADIAINPISNGSGINIKMLDYFAAGVPVVTTPIGARGIGLSNFTDAIICEKEYFADNIKRLFQDKQLYNNLSENAFSLVSNNFDWKKISNNLESVLLERLQNKK